MIKDPLAFFELLLLKVLESLILMILERRREHTRTCKQA
jgi:hypothetical protein